MPLGTVWSSEEDERLGELVKLHGPKKWSQIAADLATNKGSKQCRRRWKNFLSLEERKLGSWTPEEDAQLVECHRRHGNKWTLIAQEIGGRTDNAVKNRWAAIEKKRRLGEDNDCSQQRYSRANCGSSVLPAGTDLGVRRIIAKDQPQRSFTSRVPQGYIDANWLQESYEAMRQQNQYAQQGQGQYALQPAAYGGGQTGEVDSSMGIVKPDLRINIPGSTAPELPYSQRPGAAGADLSRMDKGDALTPVDVWLGPGMHLEAGRAEGDAMLSTSRQDTRAAMAGLTTPGATDDNSTLTELYKFLFNGATPAAQQLAAGAAAAAAAAAGQPGSAAAWRGSLQSLPQQQVPAHQSMPQQQQVPPPAMLPPAPALHYTIHQQQQVHNPQAHMSPAHDPFLQPQQPGQMLPPLGMHYSQPILQQQQQQPSHPLSKLSRTVNGFDNGPVSSAMQQQLMSEGMMLRQQLPPPQPRFVPQGPPPVTGPMVSMSGNLVSHNNAAVTTAAVGYQPMPQMQQGDPMSGVEQQHMMHRQQMPVLSSQQQPKRPAIMSQEPMLPPPQHMQPQYNMMQAQPGMQHMVPAPGPVQHPQPHSQQQWAAEDLKQLLDLLGEAAVNEGQTGHHDAPQPHLAAPALYHMDHPVVDYKLEHVNNVTGSMAAAT